MKEGLFIDIFLVTAERANRHADLRQYESNPPCRNCLDLGWDSINGVCAGPPFATNFSGCKRIDPSFRNER